MPGERIDNGNDPGNKTGSNSSSNTSESSIEKLLLQVIEVKKPNEIPEKYR